jgi:hypothetical protein
MRTWRRDLDRSIGGLSGSDRRARFLDWTRTYWIVLAALTTLVVVGVILFWAMHGGTTSVPTRV